jgi:hypothetical protein
LDFSFDYRTQRVAQNKTAEKICSTRNRCNLHIRFYIVQNNKKAETIWRDKICWTVLEFRDPFTYIESYLFEGIGSKKGEQQWGLKKGTLLIFEIYAKEVLKMDEEKIRMLAAFGHDIGKECAKKEDMGLLYSIRNAKNIDEFLRVLNDINFKLGLTVNEKLLNISNDKIMDEPWIRVKTLLSIYAMNAYLWETKKGDGNNGE